MAVDYFRFMDLKIPRWTLVSLSLSSWNSMAADPPSRAELAQNPHALQLVLAGEQLSGECLSDGY
jgi:hypothetical protein